MGKIQYNLATKEITENIEWAGCKRNLSITLVACKRNKTKKQLEFRGNCD